MRVLTSSKRGHKILFSQSSLISQFCVHLFEKLYYYTLGNKDYSRKLFWAAVDVVVNASDGWNRALVGSIDEAAETLQT